MRILMLETRRGTEDGFTIRQYRAGEIYDLTDSLARAFYAAGFAQIVKPKEAKRKKAILRRMRNPIPRLVKE